MSVAEHLGGFVPGGDPATWYPELWTWLVEQRGVRSVVDVGCGEGHAVDFFAGLRVEILGIDGIPSAHPKILQHDYTRGPQLKTWTPPQVDLVWCCEFVEHVDEQYVPNFLSTFAVGQLVLLTHAFPGQQGHHHVNCQPRDYWIGVLAAIGYHLDHDLTAITRGIASRNTNEWNHYRRSGLAFVRNDG